MLAARRANIRSLLENANIMAQDEPILLEQELGMHQTKVAIMPATENTLFSNAENAKIRGYINGIIDRLSEYVALPIISMLIQDGILIGSCKGHNALVLLVLILSMWREHPISLILAELTTRSYTGMIQGVFECDDSILSKLRFSRIGETEDIGLNTSGWHILEMNPVEEGMEVIFDVDLFTSLALEGGMWQVTYNGQVVQLFLRE